VTAEVVFSLLLLLSCKDTFISKPVWGDRLVKSCLGEKEKQCLVSPISSVEAGEHCCGGRSWSLPPPRVVSELVAAGPEKERASQQGVCQYTLHCGSPLIPWGNN